MPWARDGSMRVDGPADFGPAFVERNRDQLGQVEPAPATPTVGPRMARRHPRGGATADTVTQAVTGGILAANTLGSQPTGGPAEVKFTAALPVPDSRIAQAHARRVATQAASTWLRAWRPLAIVWRSVATDVAAVPMGTLRSGRWAYAVSGYCRTTTTVERWSAEVDAATAEVLAIGPASPRAVRRSQAVAERPSLLAVSEPQGAEPGERQGPSLLRIVVVCWLVLAGLFLFVH